MYQIKIVPNVLGSNINFSKQLGQTIHLDCNTPCTNSIFIHHAQEMFVNFQESPLGLKQSKPPLFLLAEQNKIMIFVQLD